MSEAEFKKGYRYKDGWGESYLITAVRPWGFYACRLDRKNKPTDLHMFDQRGNAGTFYADSGKFSPFGDNDINTNWNLRVDTAIPFNDVRDTT